MGYVKIGRLLVLFLINDIKGVNMFFYAPISNERLSKLNNHLRNYKLN